MLSFLSKHVRIENDPFAYFFVCIDFHSYSIKCNTRKLLLEILQMLVMFGDVFRMNSGLLVTKS